MLKDFDRYSMWDNGLFHSKTGLPSPVNIQTGRPMLIRYYLKIYNILKLINLIIANNCFIIYIFLLINLFPMFYFHFIPFVIYYKHKYVV